MSEHQSWDAGNLKTEKPASSNLKYSIVEGVVIRPTRRRQVGEPKTWIKLTSKRGDDAMAELVHTNDGRKYHNVMLMEEGDRETSHAVHYKGRPKAFDITNEVVFALWTRKADVAHVVSKQYADVKIIMVDEVVERSLQELGLDGSMTQ